MSDVLRIARGKLPKYIDFKGDGDTFKMTMDKSCTTGNMQKNNSAFEAWALYAKTENYSHVLLSECDSTVAMDESEKRHYNRFLYRVSRFEKAFDWFNVTDDLKMKVERFENEVVSRKDLFVNAPFSEGEEPDSKSLEAVVERALAKDENRERMNEILGSGIGQFSYQLPVGLFGEKKAAEKVNPSEKAIFPSDKAAIDIWGLDGKTFHLVELKVGSNYGLGVLSELFFYAYFMYDMYCCKHLERADPDDFKQYKKGGEFLREYKQLKDAKINSVVAYILTEQKHPKLQAAFDILHKNKFQGIEFKKAICRPSLSTEFGASK